MCVHVVWVWGAELEVYVQVQVCVQAPMDTLLCGAQRITLGVSPHALSPSFSETVYLSRGASGLDEVSCAVSPGTPVTHLRSSGLRKQEPAT